MENRTNELLYGALMLGRNKLVEREEYLVATGNKEPAAFKTVQKSVEITDVTEDSLSYITMLQTEPGYLEIEPFCADDFIAFDHTLITSDQFEDNRYRFYFTVRADDIHDGKNFTEIKFITAHGEVSVSVVVNNRIITRLGGMNPGRIRTGLIQNYLTFRLNRMSEKEWLEKSFALADVVNGNDPFSLFLMLFRARLNLSSRDFVSAKNLIDYVGFEIKNQRSRETEQDVLHPEGRTVLNDLECYLLYVAALYEGGSDALTFASEKIEAAMNEAPSWQKLWMVFRLDKKYDVERGKKLNRIQNLFYHQHMHSPVMYLEALEVFLRRPEMIGFATDFEIQVVSFGIKYDRFSEALICRLANIVNEIGETELAVKNTGLLIDIFRAGYKKYNDNGILKALCRLLVFAGTHDINDNYYFSQAIFQFLDVEGINPYFIFTVDKSKMHVIPDSVIEYFMENSEILLAYRSYFYANIVINKKKKPEFYKRFLGTIIAYAEEQIKKGVSDEYMAVIYEDILENDMVSHMMEENLFEVVCTRKIICENPRMERVMIFHNELSVYQEIKLVDGGAMAQIYSADAMILFKDFSGNIFANVDYEIREFVDRGEYIDLCIKATPINIHMLLTDMLPLLRAYKDPVSILEFMSQNLGQGKLRPEYERMLINDTVTYYKKHTKDEEIYDALLDFLRFRLDDTSLAHLIEIMIERTMYRAAFEEIEKYGCRGIDSKDLSRLSAVLSTLPEYNGNPLLLEMCEISFREEGYDPDIFNYLNEYYDGEINLLVEMYRAARAYGLRWQTSAEKVIRKAMNSGEFAPALPKIFAEYYDDENSDSELKFEYLEFRAGRFLSGESGGDLSFFEYIDAICKSGNVLRFSDRTYTAYLIYMSDRSEASSVVEIIKEKVESLCNKNIMFEEFKRFGKYFELPSTLINTFIVSERILEIEERKIPRISYAIMGNGQSREADEPMLEVFPGCYVRYFTLFDGDVLTYRVGNGDEQLISYSDMDIVVDSSRYSKLDRIICLRSSGDAVKLKAAVRNYFIRDKIADKLF